MARPMQNMTDFTGDLQALYRLIRRVKASPSVSTEDKTDITKDAMSVIRRVEALVVGTEEIDDA